MAAASVETPVLSVVVDCYPAIDQPFVAEELRALEARGFKLEIWSLRRPQPGKLHPVQSEVAGRVRYLPESVTAQPLRAVGAMLSALGAPGAGGALGIWLSNLVRAPGPERLRLFAQASTLHAEAGKGPRFFYAMSLANAGAVAQIAARLRGCNWACQTPEPEFWLMNDAEKAERLETVSLCITPSEAIAHVLRPMAPGLNRVVVVPPAIDLSRFGRTTELHSHRTGESKDQAVRLVSVGRLEESRGYRELLSALADMPKATRWRLVHIGEGAVASKLRQFSLDLGLGPKAIWKGACDQSEVLAALREADIYVQAPRPSAGERDGLPHALLEAASQSLPLISTRGAATAEFLVDNENALVVRSGHVPGLTEAIHRLARDPEERARLGGAARQRVEQGHNLAASADRIAGLLQVAMA